MESHSTNADIKNKPYKDDKGSDTKIEYIEDENQRAITFSKCKMEIMNKAYELSTMTGTQVLLVVESEAGFIYSFTTPKLRPIVTEPKGKNLIQACLNAPDPSKDGSQHISIFKKMRQFIRKTSTSNTINQEQLEQKDINL
ncbi:hypothetical protein K492DRAFT_187782 [Lichtheimia hyalospora FSU 10163]|nr:hypothetical protein K492DRAFT_187782 [Lichtheimia hyalospora FSU 10163]